MEHLGDRVHHLNLARPETMNTNENTDTTAGVEGRRSSPLAEVATGVRSAALALACLMAATLPAKADDTCGAEPRMREAAAVAGLGGGWSLVDQNPGAPVVVIRSTFGEVRALAAICNVKTLTSSAAVVIGMTPSADALEAVVIWSKVVQRIEGASDAAFAVKMRECLEKSRTAGDQGAVVMIPGVATFMCERQATAGYRLSVLRWIGGR